MKKLGLIINPVAGMGGKVGLKGSDGHEIIKRARALGAKPESPQRGVECLNVITEIKDQIEIITCPREMGEAEAEMAGFPFIKVIGSVKIADTSPEDTIKAAQQMAEMGVDLLLFAGGDGTARNIYEAIGEAVPVLGIPAGVKIHSAVYAVNPQRAGKAAVKFLKNNNLAIRDAEVMDIDEELFRQGVLKAKLYGFLKVPELREYMQNVKAGGYSEQEALGGIAAEVVSAMEDDALYIIGPGTTTRSVMSQLNLPHTLLGIDVVFNRQLMAQDVNEDYLYRLVQDNRAKIVVTVIGGQGHIFGRGNQQLSPRVIKKVGKENIIVVATKKKLVDLMPASLVVDTGDAELDQELCGYIRVITGFEDYVAYPVTM
ncbi:MAG: ATP-NAD kinase family protein [Dehalobacterium sp.]